MPQIISLPWIAKLDRKRLLIAALMTVVGLGSWGLLREKPRNVEEDAWDSIVFPDIANSTVTDESRYSLSESGKPRNEASLQIEPVVPGLRVEMAANVPLVLDGQWHQAPHSQRQVGEVSQVTEPIRLEGGIEPMDTTAH